MVASWSLLGAELHCLHWYFMRFCAKPGASLGKNSQILNTNGENLLRESICEWASELEREGRLEDFRDQG